MTELLRYTDFYVVSHHGCDNIVITDTHNGVDMFDNQLENATKLTDTLFVSLYVDAYDVLNVMIHDYDGKQTLYIECKTQTQANELVDNLIFMAANTSSFSLGVNLALLVHEMDLEIKA